MLWTSDGRCFNTIFYLVTLCYFTIRPLNSFFTLDFFLLQLFRFEPSSTAKGILNDEQFQFLDHNQPSSYYYQTEKLLSDLTLLQFISFKSDIIACPVEHSPCYCHKFISSISDTDWDSMWVLIHDLKGAVTHRVVVRNFLSMHHNLILLRILVMLTFHILFSFLLLLSYQSGYFFSLPFFFCYEMLI